MLNPMAYQQLLNNAQMMQNFQQQFQQFAQQFGSMNGMNPEQIVRQKLCSGEMTQEQFNQIRMMANGISGMNY